MYDIYKTRYDPTERWLKEAYREQMDAYRKQMDRDGDMLLDPDGGVFEDLQRNFGDSWSLAMNDRELFDDKGKWEQNVTEFEDEEILRRDMPDWSDEDVLLGYLIREEEEGGGIDREELDGILYTIYSGVQPYNSYHSYPNSYHSDYQDSLQGIT